MINVELPDFSSVLCSFQGAKCFYGLIELHLPGSLFCQISPESSSVGVNYALSKRQDIRGGSGGRQNMEGVPQSFLENS